MSPKQVGIHRFGMTLSKCLTDMYWPLNLEFIITICSNLILHNNNFRKIVLMIVILEDSFDEKAVLVAKNWGGILHGGFFVFSYVFSFLFSGKRGLIWEGKKWSRKLGTHVHMNKINLLMSSEVPCFGGELSGISPPVFYVLIFDNH